MATAGKPKGRMSAYTFFVQTCREEHRRNFPSESVSFTDFSKQCSNRWKSMTDNEKRKFIEMANNDKIRYQNEMSTYAPLGGEKRKRRKDPNAPKRPLSAFFLFCADERPKVRDDHPDLTVGEIAKELGERWAGLSSDAKRKYYERHQKDRARYQREKKAYGEAGAGKRRRVGRARTTTAADNGDGPDDDEEEEEEDYEGRV